MEARLVEYAQRDSLLHSMDPRWKLAAILLSAVAVVTLQNVGAAALACLASLSLLLVTRLPWDWFLARLGGVALFLSLFLFLLPLTMSGEEIQLGPVDVSLLGLEIAALVCFKALAVVALVLLLLATAPFETTLKAAHALAVPSILIQLLMLTYRYIFLLAEELHKLRIALRLRGYRNRACAHCYRTVGHVAGTILVRSYERAERVGQAMRCRGFDGQFRSLRSFASRGVDVGKFFLIALPFVCLGLWDRLK
jgi:cobalt/nickel transport system permease protein